MPDPPLPPPDLLHRWMTLALDEARAAADADEVPVGAVVAHLHTHQILGRGRDRKVELSDPTAHAEILAMRQAADTLGDWRLENCALVVTLEPCPMCAGAAILARIPHVIFGATNPKFGATGTLLDLPTAAPWNHQVQITGGILQAECSDILKTYFRRKRTQRAT